MIEQLNNYYLTKEEPVRGCLLALRYIILNQDKNMTETQKWGMPCFCFKQKIVCYLWTDKKTDEPYILFAEGKYFKHPELETGNRSRMKILRINPNIDIPKETIDDIIQQALKIYETGSLKSRKHASS